MYLYNTLHFTEDQSYGGTVFRKRNIDQIRWPDKWLERSPSVSCWCCESWLFSNSRPSWNDIVQRIEPDGTGNCPSLCAKLKYPTPKVRVHTYIWPTSVRVKSTYFKTIPILNETITRVPSKRTISIVNNITAFQKFAKNVKSKLYYLVVYIEPYIIMIYKCTYITRPW